VQLFRKILSKINGLHYKQEYLCLDNETFEQPLHAYLIRNGDLAKDITIQHAFVGYSPLIFALSSKTPDGEPVEIEIAFLQQQLTGKAVSNDWLAGLTLQKIRSFDSIVFYQGKNGWHHFTKRLHQLVGGLDNNLYNHKPGNVFLDNGLYKQVQVAYSIPRKISLITVGNGDFFNLFPTDLHGSVDGFYIISLRHEGLACKQVEQVGRIVLSEMTSSVYKQVYSLGKNHMQPLKSMESFPFSAEASKHFQLPLPKGNNGYKELELVHSFIYGIHKLLIFSIVSEVRSANTDSSLVHIHNVYATWRNKTGIKTNYLLR
jgi:flavin reductase (DIM6/NTAB) family NADH-FMN oxidoreductase RutF